MCFSVDNLRVDKKNNTRELKFLKDEQKPQIKQEERIFSFRSLMRTPTEFLPHTTF